MSLPLGNTDVENCFVVFIVAWSPSFFAWIRALAGVFVTHSLDMASGYGLTPDVSTLVYAFARAIAVTLVFNCLCIAVITLGALFLGRIRAYASTLVALSHHKTLAFGFALGLALTFINLRSTNANPFVTLIVDCVSVFVVAFCFVRLVFPTAFAVVANARIHANTLLCTRDAETLVVRADS